MHIDNSYSNLLTEVLNKGHWYEDPNRKGVQRLEIPSYTFRHEFKDGFPAISTKKLFYKSVLTELIWFLTGNTNIKYLVDNGCNIWNKDAYNHFLKSKPTLTKARSIYDKKVVDFNKEDENHFKLWLGCVKNKESGLGDLGPVYGHQWVKSTKMIPTGSGHYTKKTINQIQELMKNMIEKPMSSELIVNAWNPVDLDEMALQPCHYGFQVIMIPSSIHDLSREEYKSFRRYYVESVDVSSTDVITMAQFYSKCSKYNKPKGFELHWNQRSSDLLLGIPYNIASYATLALILETVTGHKALGIQGNLSKVHLYDNAIEGAKEQLKRKSNNKKVDLLMKDEFYFLCDLINFKDFDYFEFINKLKNDFFILENYEPHPAIRVEMLERN